MANFWNGLGYSVLNEFISSFLHGKDGFAKPSRYEVVIGPPKGMQGGGPLREIVMGSTYEDVSATFYVSSDHKEQKFFHDWQNTAYNMNDDDNFGANYYFNYVGNIDIYQLDEKDTRRLGIRVMEAFPKTIGSIEMGYGSTNEIEKMSVSFSYRYWDILPGGGGSSFLDRLSNIAISHVERKLISKLPKVLTRL